MTNHTKTLEALVAAGDEYAKAEHEADRDTFVKVNERYYELMDGVVLDWGRNTQQKRNMQRDDAGEITHEAWYKFQTQGKSPMTREVYDTMIKEFTDAELKLWITGGAR